MLHSCPLSRNFDHLHPAPNSKPSLISGAPGSYPWSYWKHLDPGTESHMALHRSLSERLCLYLPSYKYSPYHPYLTSCCEIMTCPDSSLTQNTLNSGNHHSGTASCLYLPASTSHNSLFHVFSLLRVHRDACLALQHGFALSVLISYLYMLFVCTGVGGDLKYELTVQSWAEMLLILSSQEGKNPEHKRKACLTLWLVQ